MISKNICSNKVQIGGDYMAKKPTKKQLSNAGAKLASDSSTKKELSKAGSTLAKG